MNKIFYYTVIIIFSMLSKAIAQEKTFEQQAKEIAANIEMITTEEKNALKKEVEAIDLQAKEGKIYAEKAQELKTKIAQERANNIETKVAIEVAKLAQLVQDKVDGKLKEDKKDSVWINYGYGKIYKKRIYAHKSNKRTISQFVFAMGLNNVITEGENLENSDFRVWGSHFYEWGITYNSRIFKNNNLLHAKYGFSLMYNNLRPTDNRFFLKNGNQTNLETASFHLDDSRFRNVYFAVPVHLEFDFSPKKQSKDGSKSYFRTHESVRLGIGGYAGIRIKSKQLLHYEENGNDIKNKEKGDFNVSDFSYGLSTYIGYRATSLYLKYDLNPMFKNNTFEQNNVSLGIRFDFN